MHALHGPMQEKWVGPSRTTFLVNCHVRNHSYVPPSPLSSSCSRLTHAPRTRAPGNWLSRRSAFLDGGDSPAQRSCGRNASSNTIKTRHPAYQPARGTLLAASRTSRRRSRSHPAAGALIQYVHFGVESCPLLAICSSVACSSE